ncbi:MAG: triose-phosphate isomerase, partial [Chloroflexi bacterium]|nr:triose-phosphate isomerase [Chloroflexota bacterium]
MEHRKPLIAGNWKMNTTLPEALALVGAMKGRLEAIPGVEVVLCPPFISLSALAGALKGSPIGLGAQNMYFQEKGAYTGEVSPLMLRGLCQYVILGHSERRHYFGEADELINKKMRAALAWGLKPILCVGERLEEREKGQAEAVVERQLRGALEGAADPDGLVVAYEPVWAIGTGRAATPADAQETMAFLRRILGECCGGSTAQALRLLYGGSVTKDNVAPFLKERDIDGALVGGASLKAEEFLGIVEQASTIRS